MKLDLFTLIELSVLTVSLNMFTPTHRRGTGPTTNVWVLACKQFLFWHLAQNVYHYVNSNSYVTYN